MTVQINGTTGITTPDINSSTQTVVTETATTITTNTLNTSNLNQNSMPVYPCKAWATFSGTTSGSNPPTSGANIASVNRTGTGNYTITFTNAMSNSNYSVLVTPSGASGYNTAIPTISTKTTSSFTIVVTGISGATNTSADPTSVNIMVIS